MSKLEKAARQALEALGVASRNGSDGLDRYQIKELDDAIAELHAAIAPQPEQEPLASLMTHIESGDVKLVWNDEAFDLTLWRETPLYTAPPQRKPLTEQEIERIAQSVRVDPIHAKKSTWHIRLIRAIEKAHVIE
jgi:hypothetical protein